MLFFLFLVYFPSETPFPSHLQLETDGRFLGDIEPYRSQVAKDHTVILASDHTVYHFDLETGKMIRQFGSNGQGPMEFGNIRVINWTGGYYLVVDAGALKTTLVDASGKWVWTKPIYFRAISGTMEFLVGDGRTTPLKDYKNRIPKLQIFSYGKDGFEKKSGYFHLVSQEVINLGLNYSKHFVAMDRGKIYVIDEILPTVFVYNQSNLMEIERIPLFMPGFVPGPNEFPKFRMPPNMKKYWKWHWSWSRINKIEVFKNKLIIGYDLVCEDISADGCPDRTGGCYVYDLKAKRGTFIEIEHGWLLGVSKGKLITFVDWDDEKTNKPIYFIHKIDLP